MTWISIIRRYLKQLFLGRCWQPCGALFAFSASFCASCWSSSLASTHAAGPSQMLPVRHYKSETSCASVTSWRSCCLLGPTNGILEAATHLPWNLWHRANEIQVFQTCSIFLQSYPNLSSNLSKLHSFSSFCLPISRCIFQHDSISNSSLNVHHRGRRVRHRVMQHACNHWRGLHHILRGCETQLALTLGKRWH